MKPETLLKNYTQTFLGLVKWWKKKHDSNIKLTNTVHSFYSAHTFLFQAWCAEVT